MALFRKLEKRVGKKKYKQLHTVFVSIAGGLVILVGILLLFLPGPAFIVIPAGFAILATEFPWAKRLKDRFMEKYHKFRKAHSH